LAFGRHVAWPGGGAAYLDDDGTPDVAQGVQTWITARTVHVYCLGHLLGVPGSAPIADAALAGLTGALRDQALGGWFHALDAQGVPDRDSGKSCYDHAFVLLAAASATVAGRPGGRELLAEAIDTYLSHFWDPVSGLVIDTWNADFSVAESYRGLNATMHSVEAMLSVADAVAPAEAPAWLERVLSAARFAARLAGQYDGRLPEHFDSAWTPDLELNKDRPSDPFKPFGATPGHGLEWARLLLHAEAATRDTASGLAEAAARLFDRAVADAWAVDGAEGFAYTTDWAGTPVVHDRMHWVVAEAINVAAALFERTGDQHYAEWYARWWDYAERYVLDHAHGSWHHELDRVNRPAAAVWPGKPDLYHAVQATLIPRLPLTPMVARALQTGQLR
jgi:mannose/cellobiose epimerase-like protein (N-acyl-D-glucosamine 2-epimerase family)